MSVTRIVAPATPSLINSGDLINTDQHFRVAAGPGAGKTFWLVGHVRNVLAKSKLLGNSRKIACITYTNTAVDTILRRLDFVADKVEVATIHSFLYKHIVKPYIGFLPVEWQVNGGLVDNHDEHVPTGKVVNVWLNNHTNKDAFTHPYSLGQMLGRREVLGAIQRWLASFHYQIQADGSCVMQVDNSEAYYLDGGKRKLLGAVSCTNKLAPGLQEYKMNYWRQGIIHHEDVLYFSHWLIRRFPFIIQVICAKFPYFFIDEFQDTSPIQTYLLHAFGQGGTNVGIIGDRAQSIYGFQGAKPEHFENFELQGLYSYVINDNRRSTNAIINVLNSIRKDITQNPIRKEVGEMPVLYVGDPFAACDSAKRICGSAPLVVLSWDNRTVNVMKRKYDSSIPPTDLIDLLAERDSNPERRRAVKAYITAVELAKEKKFKDAIRALSQLFRALSLHERKKVSFHHLVFLLSKYESYRSRPLSEFCQIIRTNINSSLTSFKAGGAKTFYDTYNYEQVAVCLKLADDSPFSRTIHRAKGDEFPNVILVLKNPEDIQFLIGADLHKTERHRLFYVGISRAMDRLFINVPFLAADKQEKIRQYFTIEMV